MRLGSQPLERDHRFESDGFDQLKDQLGLSTLFPPRRAVRA